jgi:hypothetical protein
LASHGWIFFKRKFHSLTLIYRFSWFISFAQVHCVRVSQIYVFVPRNRNFFHNSHTRAFCWKQKSFLIVIIIKNVTSEWVCVTNRWKAIKHVNSKTHFILFVHFDSLILSVCATDLQNAFHSLSLYISLYMYVCAVR